MTDERDPWTKMELPDGVVNCPCCGSIPQMYKYLEVPEGPRRLEISCSNIEPLRKDAHSMWTCPLISPPTFFLDETIRGAVWTWNTYAADLIKVRTQNAKETL